MQDCDGRVLESLERIYRCLEAEIEKLSDLRAVPLDGLREMARETKGYARLLEEISAAGRVVVEYALLLKRDDGRIALETDAVRQGFCAVRRVHIEEFGVLRLDLGDARLTWRDGGCNYLFYPDKLEMRAQDERTAVKLFFSRSFDRQFLRHKGDLLACPLTSYVHPELEEILREELRSAE
ncbi:MAG: hypothetical protein LBS10_03070 [Gracilibacteraceae bacterium]|nr:hypothetical protein [Gracilibacteraceae bacterium]